MGGTRPASDNRQIDVVFQRAGGVLMDAATGPTVLVGASDHFMAARLKVRTDLGGIARA